MTSAFAALWQHVDRCDTCSHAELGLCREGDKLLEAAVNNTAERMAPMPKEGAKA